MTMQTMEFFSEISDSGGPWSLTRNVMSVGPGPSISKNDITLSLPPDMVKYTKLSQLSRLPDPSLPTYAPRCTKNVSFTSFACPASALKALQTPVRRSHTPVRLGGAVDDMEPTVIAIENKISSLPAKEAVAALHHLRRLSWQAQYQVQRNRLESIMNVFAQVASQKLNNLTTKSIALLLSSLSDRDNFQPVFDKAAVCSLFFLPSAPSIAPFSPLPSPCDCPLPPFPVAPSFLAPPLPAPLPPHLELGPHSLCHSARRRD